MTSVKLADRHSWFYPNSFEYCTSLKSIDIPGNTWQIGEYTFKGCSSLTGITFKEPSHLNHHGLRNYMLSGTAIENLVLPEAVDSFAYIMDYAFAGMDKLKSI